MMYFCRDSGSVCHLHISRSVVNHAVMCRQFGACMELHDVKLCAAVHLGCTKTKMTEYVQFYFAPSIKYCVCVQHVKLT